MTLLAIGINIGVWINRYLIVMPSLVEAHSPFMSFQEITMLLSMISGFLLILLFLITLVPIVTNWELQAVEDD